ncbi:MAG TPA: polysaccharide lyase, partial [Puia sp.]
MRQRLSIAILSVSFALSAQAQYPTIPRDLEARGDSVMNGYKLLSDKAWEKALPIVEADEKKG